MELITSLQNPKIKELVLLKTKTTTEDTKKFFLDGLHLCEEAFKHHRLLSLYLETDKWPSLPVAFHNFSGPVFWISEAISKKLSGTKNPTGIYGEARIVDQPWLKSENILVLDDVQDPGNLGTLLRSAAAFNFPNILISPKSVSFYNEKVLRSTQGLIFKLNLKQAPIESFLENFQSQKWPIIGTSFKKPFQSLTNFKKVAHPVVLIMGNEGHGLSAMSEAMISTNVLIPMTPTVDSLNVGVAGSIMMYELSKKSIC